MDASENGLRKKSYAEMRREGLCKWCGKPNPTPEKSMCPICREKHNANRRLTIAYLKSRGLCIRCGKNEPEPNRVMCLECSGRESDNYYKRGGASKERRLREKEYKRIQAEKRKEEGLCIKCGKRKPAQGRLECQRCLDYMIRWRGKNSDGIKRSERRGYGLCYICGKPAIDGMGVCESCYEVRMAVMPKMFEKRDNSVWKKIINEDVAKGRSIKQKYACK